VTTISCPETTIWSALPALGDLRKLALVFFRLRLAFATFASVGKTDAAPNLLHLLRVFHAQMLAVARHQFQVLKAIVELVFVDVMDYGFWWDRSVGLLPDEAMLLDVTTIESQNAVAILDGSRPVRSTMQWFERISVSTPAGVMAGAVAVAETMGFATFDGADLSHAPKDTIAK
jgi:hypothetical protein